MPPWAAVKINCFVNSAWSADPALRRPKFRENPSLVAVFSSPSSCRWTVAQQPHRQEPHRLLRSLPAPGAQAREDVRPS